MELTEEQYKRIEKYVLGKMTAEEERLFELERQNHPAMESEFSNLREVLALASSPLRRNLNQAEPSQEKVRSSRITVFIALAMIASAVIIFFASRIGTNPDPDFYSIHYSVDFETIQPLKLKGGSWALAVDKFNQEKFKESYGYIASLMGDYPNSDTLRYMKASSLMATGSYLAADRDYAQIPATSDLFEKSQWYRALIAWRNKDIAASKQILEDLQYRSSSISANAQLFLRQVEEMDREP